MKLFIIACSAFKTATQPVKFTCEPKEGVSLAVSGKNTNIVQQIEVPRHQGYILSVFNYNFKHLVYV